MQIQAADQQFPPDLEAIAAAILDGTPIDWKNISQDTDPELVRQLQVLSDLVTLHRSLSSDSDVTVTQTRPSELAAGSQWGPLRLLEVIGEGAFGQVFRAWDTRLDREVALKLLHAQSGAPDDAEASIQEGRLLARVHHPNIVTVYGAERVDGRVGIWTEFIRGRTLAYLMKEHGRFSAHEASAIGIDLCRALSAVHAAGLLHRDVKPQNVMREQGGRIVLMDFGAGKERRVTPFDAGTDLAGTPLYTAPELWRGDRATPQSDIYSVGVVLFYLVSGAFPVQGTSVAEIQEAHRASRRHLLRDARPEAPDSFIEVIERALEPDPARRYESAGAFEAALKHAQHALEPPAWRRRFLVIAGVAAAALIVVALTFAPGSAVVGRLLRAGMGSPGGGDRPAVDVTSTSVRQLKLPPFSLIGRPSRDGRFLPYVDLSGQLWIWEIATGQSHQVTKKGDPQEWTWGSLMAPDGSRVAYTFVRPDGVYELRVVESDGRWSRVVLPGETGPAAGEPEPLEWSHDGQQILYLLSRENGSSDLALVAPEGGARVVLASFRTGTPKHATISPDGRFVVYDLPASDRAAERDLMIVPSDGSSAPKPLLTGPFNDLLPLWTPDGNGILFASDRSGQMSGWLLPMAEDKVAGEATFVARNLGRIWPLGLTDTGAYFYGLQVGAAEVYTATIDVTGATPPGDPARISQSVTLGHMGPAWSPDGGTIAYVALKGETAQDRDSNALVIQDVVSGKTRHLDTPSLSHVGVVAPQWSPDGRQLLVRGRDNTNREGLYVIDVQTGALAAALPVGSKNRYYWSSDGRSILYMDAGRIVSHSIATGAKAVLFDAAAHDLTRVSFGPSPDGDGFALTALKKDQRWALLVYRSSGVLQEIYSPAKAFIVFQGWTPDAQQILFTVAGPLPQRLLRINAGGGEPVDIGISIQGFTEVNFVALSPDGTRVAYTAGEPGVQIWMMEKFLPQ